MINYPVYKVDITKENFEKCCEIAMRLLVDSNINKVTNFWGSVGACPRRRCPQGATLQLRP